MPIRVIYMAYCFLREALHRLVGTDREASPVTVAFTLGVLGSACQPLVAPLARALARPRPALPSPATSFMGLAVVRYAARAIGGEPLQSTPYASAIVTAAMARPAFQVAALPVHVLRAALAALARGWRYLTVGAIRPQSRRLGG